MQLYNAYQGYCADYTEPFDSTRAETAYVLDDPVWNHLDSQLGSMHHYEYSSSLGWKKRYYDDPRPFTAYDQTAHGFSLESQLQTDNHLYQVGHGTALHRDLDQYRHLRYVSPTEGGSLTSSDSTFSDYAFSPDVARGAQALTSFPPGAVYPSPASNCARDYFSPIYQQPRPSVLPCSIPAMASPTACSMREVQYTPDHDLNDVGMDNSEIKIKVQSSEGIEELPEEASPHDSGLGQSVNDADDLDEDYETPKAESDDDSDFTPHRAPHHVQSTSLRSSLRTPRRTTSSQPSSLGVQDQDPRVHRSSNGKSKRKLSSNNNNKIPTAKKKARGTTTTATKHNNRPKEKSFPCPFHPFGCPATFPSKNEWKRHTASQHLQLGYYRCDLGACHPLHESGVTVSRGYNDFNRKDLFTQHCRRMHRPEEAWGRREYNQVGKRERMEFDGFMEGVRARCWRKRRGAPRWLRCGVGGCGREFGRRKGDGGVEEEGRAWEERMEHVAWHYELGVGRGEEGVDEGLREWAVEEGVVGGSGLLVGLEGEAIAEEVKGMGGNTRSRRGGGYSLRGSGKLDHALDLEVREIGEGVIEGRVKAASNEDDDTDAEGEDE